MSTFVDDRALTCSTTMKTMISLLSFLHASKIDVKNDFFVTLLSMIQRSNNEQYVLFSKISTSTNKKCHIFCAEHILNERSIVNWQKIDAKNRKIIFTRRCIFERLLKIARTTSQQFSLSFLIKRSKIIFDENDEIREKSESITFVNIRVYCFNAWLQMQWNRDIIRSKRTRKMNYFHANWMIFVNKHSEKNAMFQFSLTRIVRHVFHIENQWRQRAQKMTSKFRITKTSWCLAWFQLVRFSDFVQQFMNEKLKQIDKIIENEKNVLDVKNKIVCFVDNDCLFYRQYQFSCRHIWHQNILFDCVKNENWNRFAFDFEKRNFEIYEIINKKWIFESVHDAIKNFNRHLLKIRKVFDDIKNKYYELCENMTKWISKERFFIFDRWLNQLNNLIVFIRQK